MIDGHSVAIDSPSDLLSLGEIFIDGEYEEAIAALPTDGKWFVLDLGCNKGYFARRLLKERRRTDRAAGTGPSQGMDYVGVDANKRLLKDSRGLAQEAEYGNRIAFYCGLIGRRSGSGEFMSRYHHLASRVIEHPKWRSRSMKYFDLDLVVGSINTINLLKIDIEGSEYEFIKEYESIINRSTVIAIEYHGTLGDIAEGKAMLNKGRELEVIGCRKKERTETVIYRRKS